MASIREFPHLPRLPDFCNLGTWLRVLLAANVMALAAALLRNRGLGTLPGEFTELAAFVEPVTIGSLSVLCLGRRLLAELDGRWVALAATAVAAALAAAVAALLAPLTGESPSWRAPFWAALAALVLIGYFDLRVRAHSPAVAEARLMALTARIRPHFLFNSLNAVLGVIRSEPRRAEAVLEELAELFRALMRDNRELVPLSEEIALARQYLELERLRLGERLRVVWDVESCPPDARVPPLMLQPLLENAVYHGIEPSPAPAEIRIRLARQSDRVVIELSNPHVPASDHHAGNHMALANIRERLALFFDLEARMTAEARGDRYLVRIELPYQAPGGHD
jgi:two-component system sensor histidine kinase AlgZ